MVIYAKEHGITSGADVSKPLLALTQWLAGISGQKELVFAPGEYYLTAENCYRDKFFVTNTVGDGEFDKGETPHEASVGIYFNGIENLTVEATGAIFLLDGKMTACAVINCSSLTVTGLEIRHINPDEHELTVTAKTPFSVDFRLDRESRYEKIKGEYYFIGRDYKTHFFENRLKSWGWFGRIFSSNPNRICRIKHPFFGALLLRELSPSVFRAVYPGTRRFSVGDRLCVFNTRRQNVGIFVDSSSDITLKGVTQCFNYSLAFVAQNSEGITLDGVRFAPCEQQDKRLASLADFIQICMCRGEVTVKNSYFCGAGDDCLNVHGIHFKVTDVSGNSFTARFMHPQTHGFNPLRAGDEIEFVDPETLLPTGKARITASTLINETDIRLTTDSVDGLTENSVIEDISACPSLSFINNKMTRIITRGILVTTRGRVTVENNDFDNTEMSAILFSDDAKNWYESGRCTDVTIKNNRFGRCGAFNIQILPENGSTGSVVHGSFTVTGNSFESPENGGIDAHCCEKITLSGNKGISSGFLKCENVSFVETRSF